VKRRHVGLDRLELSPARLAVDAFLEKEQNGLSPLVGKVEISSTV
jgi:hypothetical protein